MSRYNLFTSFIILTLVISIFNNCSSDDDSSDNTNPQNETTKVVFNPDLPYGVMTDQDGNSYKTITIGTQTWMAENLRTTKYRNGTPIPNVTNNLAWNPLTTGAYCTYENTTDQSEIATYGRLYNWFAVNDSSNLAPVGWHVATDAEWDTVTTFLEGIDVAGAQMKETGTSHWNSPNLDATNLSGFSATPSGYRNFYDGVFKSKSEYGYYWSSNEFNNSYAYYRYLYFDDKTCKRFYINKIYGCSVRCVKD